MIFQCIIGHCAFADTYPKLTKVTHFEESRKFFNNFLKSFFRKCNFPLAFFEKIATHDRGQKKGANLCLPPFFYGKSFGLFILQGLTIRIAGLRTLYKLGQLGKVAATGIHLLQLI